MSLRKKKLTNIIVPEKLFPVIQVGTNQGNDIVIEPDKEVIKNSDIDMRSPREIKFQDAIDDVRTELKKIKLCPIKKIEVIEIPDTKKKEKDTIIFDE